MKGSFGNEIAHERNPSERKIVRQLAGDTSLGLSLYGRRDGGSSGVLFLLAFGLLVTNYESERIVLNCLCTDLQSSLLQAI